VRGEEKNMKLEDSPVCKKYDRFLTEVAKGVFEPFVDDLEKVNCSWIYNDGAHGKGVNLENHTFVNGFDKAETETIPKEFLCMTFADALGSSLKSLIEFRTKYHGHKMFWRIGPDVDIIDIDNEYSLIRYRILLKPVEMKGEEKI
jgi:hypothetical protein